MFVEVKAEYQELQASGLISHEPAWAYFRKNSATFLGTVTARAYNVLDTIDHPRKKMIVTCEELTFLGRTIRMAICSSRNPQARWESNTGGCWVILRLR